MYDITKQINMLSFNINLINVIIYQQKKMNSLILLNFVFMKRLE